MNLGNEFRKYATKHMGISSMGLHYWDKRQQVINNGKDVASLTPMILEERELRATQIDVFSRLMMDRIIWLSGPVDDHMSTVVQAQLMFLDNLEVRDITLHVDTPGGGVKSGLGIVDVMDYVSSDIVTINTGMAASMGSILLGAGTKGKRHSLRFSKVMLHQVSSGVSGNIQDMRVTFAETEKYNTILFGLLGEYTNKTPEQVLTDSQRDMWMTSGEAVDYGIIDSVITNKRRVKK